MNQPRQELLRYLHQLAEREPVIVLDAPLKQTKAGVEPDDRPERLAELAQETSTCTLCQLSETRQNVVFGAGDARAAMLLVGEAPGVDEDRLGEPFVGRAGKLLDRILSAMNISRQDVYIANILKCRPPGNRNPLPNEAASCLPYLRRQIDIIQPQVIVALGLIAAVHLLNMRPNVAVKALRERIFDCRGRPLVVTYHPAALLRTPSLKAPLWQDMQMVMKLLSGEIGWQPESSLVLEV